MPACHRNRRLVIECKTVRFKGGDHDTALTDKVKSVSEDTRGLLGDTWVIVAQAPTPG